MTSYHDGHRQLQDVFDSRRIADRLEAVTYREALSAGDRAVVEAADMFFLATADPAGNPDCSYKGGDPGFVRVVSDTELAWPDYDGNGQFRSLGNLLVHAPVALLFIDWARPGRLRVHGRARISSTIRSWRRCRAVSSWCGWRSSACSRTARVTSTR